MSPKKQFKWSSHNPVIMTALELLSPEFVLELGVGNFSTPLFLASSATKIWHIENDRPWLDHVLAHFKIDHRSEFRYHEISDRVNKSTAWSSLPTDLQAAQHTYYTGLAHEISQEAITPRLLFVDHFTCVRTLSINLLAEQFDWVIYHDAETPEVYGYQDIDRALSNDFDQYVLHTSSSWTGMLIRRDKIVGEDIHTAMMANCETFGRSYGRSIAEFSLEKI